MEIDEGEYGIMAGCFDELWASFLDMGMQIGLALLTSNYQTYDHGIKLCIDT